MINKPVFYIPIIGVMFLVLTVFIYTGVQKRILEYEMFEHQKQLNSQRHKREERNLIAEEKRLTAEERRLTAEEKITTIREKNLELKKYDLGLVSTFGIKKGCDGKGRCKK